MSTIIISLQEVVDIVYVDGTGKTEGAYTSLAEAASRLPDAGGTIIVCGDTVLGTSSVIETMPEKSGKLTITGENGAKLIVAYVLAFGCETEIDNIELCNASTVGYIYAMGHKLTIGENVTTTKADGISNYLWLFGGHPNFDVASTHLVVKAGSYRYIYGANFNATFTGASKVEVSGVTAADVISAKSINTGTFKGTAELIIDLRGNKTVTAASFATPVTVLTDDGYEAVKVGNTYSQKIAVQKPTTVYADGVGAAENTYATLEEAVAALSNEGGTVIVCGDTVAGSNNATLYLPEKSGKVTITGENGAKLSIAYVLCLGSETEIDNIELCNASAYGYVYAMGHKLTIGENVITTKAAGISNYLWLFGGHPDNDLPSTHLVIKAGTYKYIFGANFNAKFTGTSKVEASNITTEYLSAKCLNGNAGVFTGTAEMIIDLRGNKTVTANNFVEPYTILVDKGYEAVKNGNTYKQERVVVLGDANGDGSVTVVDALLILKAVLNDNSVENADMNGDGVLSLVDVMRVLKLATK